MTREEKIVRKMLQSRSNVRFEDVDNLLRRRGFEVRQPSGGSSHYIYTRSSDGMRTTVVKPHGSNKTVHPKKVDELVEMLKLGEENEEQDEKE